MSTTFNEDVLVNANLGVGTSSPGARVDVVAASGTIALRAQAAICTVTLGPDSPSSALEVVGQPEEAFGLEVAIENTKSGGGRYLFAVTDATSGGATDGMWILLDHTPTHEPPTERISVDNTGKVGIGTAYQEVQLHVVKEDASTDSVLEMLRLTHATTATAANGIGARLSFEVERADDEVSQAASIDGIWIHAAAGNEDGGLIFNTARNGGIPTERVRINHLGNLGVGIKNPSSRLHVDGGVQVGSPTGGDRGTGTINVSGDIYKNGTAYNNPDYVFAQHFDGSNDAGYGGMVPLERLEERLRSERHLPGIVHEPMGVFQRQDVLLEKLEEAYLHIIELTKRVQRLESTHTVEA